MPHRLLVFLLSLILLASLASAANLEERVVEHRLANGLTLLLMERHQAPIVAVNLTYKVGGVYEHNGITGVAHLYEHMAFKGTRTIGVTDAEKEKPVLEELDRLAEAILAEKAKGPAADEARLATLRKRFTEVEAQAQQFVVPAELASLYQRNGGVGLNASTGKDLTRYYLSFPSNRLPLWASVESDRMANGVLREFYKEKKVVLEERRQRTDNSPSGRLDEAFAAAAFMAHPDRLAFRPGGAQPGPNRGVLPDLLRSRQRGPGRRGRHQAQGGHRPRGEYVWQDPGPPAFSARADRGAPTRRRAPGGGRIFR